MTPSKTVVKNRLIKILRRVIREKSLSLVLSSFNYMASHGCYMHNRRYEAFLLILTICIFGLTKTIAITSDTWQSPRHDNQNSGYSISTVPYTNQTVWINEGIKSITPIIADGKVYCTGGRFTGLTALDLNNGSVLWKNMLGSFAVPTVVDGIIYAGTLGGEVWAINSNTGDIIWKYSIFGYGEPLSTPKVANERVFFNNRDGWLFCVNATNAETLWKYETRLAEVSGLAIADGRVFTMYSALNETDGTQLWDIWENGDKPSSIHYTYHTPTVSDGKVILSIDSSIQAVDEFNGSLIWRFDTVNDPSDVAVAYGRVFVTADNFLYCLDEDDGKEIWRYGKAEFNWLSSIPSVADEKVIVPTLENLICIDANNADFLWSYFTISSQSLPAIVEDKVLFSSPDGMVAIGGQKSEVTSDFTFIIGISVIIASIVILVIILNHQKRKS